VIKDRKGRIVEDVQSLRVPRDGREIVLSIDQRLQFLAHRELRRRSSQPRPGRRDGDAGRAHRRDPGTGEPADYNPNNRASVTGRQTRNRSVTESSSRVRR